MADSFLRFHLFAGDSYYPQSGLGDYQGSHETLVDALAAPRGTSDWWVVVETQDDGSLSEVRRGTTGLYK